MNFKSTDHEAQYNQARKAVRVLRQRIMENTDEKIQVIDRVLNEQLETELEAAKIKLTRLTPKTQSTRSAMYLRAYA